MNGKSSQDRIAPNVTPSSPLPIDLLIHAMCAWLEDDDFKCGEKPQKLSVDFSAAFEKRIIFSGKNHLIIF